MRMINPSLWWLLLLALIPILIHILLRQRVPRVPWAAQTFVLRALRKNRRKLFLETLLLLLVRTAIILVIALILLRPVSDVLAGLFGSGRPPTASVIVLDDSSSMAASDGLQSRFERGISRVDQYLDELPGGSRVAVILAGDPPDFLIRRPTRDLEYARGLLSRAKPRDGRGAIGLALAEAKKVLADETIPNREIVVVTDVQSADWERDRSGLGSALAAASEGASVLMLKVPATPPANVAVRNVAVSGGPQATIPGFVSTLWPSNVEVTLVTDHHEEKVDTAVELFIDGQKVARRRVEVAPGRPTSVTFESVLGGLSTAGTHVVGARCESDLFERDNSYSIVVRSRERIGVLVIEGRPDPDPFSAASGYLRAVLRSFTPEEETVSLFDVQVATVGELESFRISDYPLIVLADVPVLPSGALRQIKASVRGGAGLLIVAGGQPTAQGMKAMFHDDGKGPMPVEMAPAIDLPEETDTIGISLTEPVPPALSAFEERSLAEALSSAGWRTLRPVGNVGESSAQTWANFTRGGAAVVANDYGDGRVVYFGGTVDRQGGEFPLSPAFVPFVQQLCFHLIGGGEKSSHEAGERLAWPVRGEEHAVVLPDGTEESAGGLTLLDEATGAERIVLPFAGRAGLYRLRSKEGAVLGKRVANVPADESDLAVMDDKALGKITAGSVARVIAPEESLKEALRSVGSESELWTLGLLVLLVLIALELLLIRIFTPKPVDAGALLEKAMRL